MRFIDKYIEWIVALAVIQISILLLDNFFKWIFPSMDFLFTLANYTVLLLMLFYQKKHYGWKPRNRSFMFFFSIYSLYIFLYMTILRKYPLEDMLGIPASIRGFFILTVLIFGYLICAETICNNFNYRKFFYLSVFFTLIPATLFVAIVGVNFFQFAEWTEDDNALQVTSLTYNNVPLFVLALLLHNDLANNKLISNIISITVVMIVGYILLMSTRRGPLLWSILNLIICYFCRSRKVLIYIILVSLFCILVYLNIDTIVGWISSLFPSTGDRINASLYEGSTSGRYDPDNPERSTYILGFNQFLQSPLCGSYFRILTTDYTFRGVYPHNIFIEMLMTMGLLGFVPFCYFLKKVFINNSIYYKRDNNKLALFSLFLSSFLQLQTGDSIVFNIWFWVLFYVVLIVGHKQPKKTYVVNC